MNKFLCVALVAILVTLAVVPVSAIPVECVYARYASWAAIGCAMQMAADIWLYGNGPNHTADGDGLSG